MTRLYNALMWAASLASLVSFQFVLVYTEQNVRKFTWGAGHSVDLMTTPMWVYYHLALPAIAVPLLLFAGLFAIWKYGVHEKYAPIHIAIGWVFSLTWALWSILTWSAFRVGG